MSQKSDKPRGVFDDFSFSTVVASALTAATSFLLSSKIGLAGSLIGAMSAAVISTACTQVYKGMLTASADRIKEVAEPTVVFGEHMGSGTRYTSARTHEIGRFARRLVVFAACVSLAAVLVSAAVIAFATRGAGLGPTSWETATVVEEAEETASEAKDDAATIADKAETKVDALVTETAQNGETSAAAPAPSDSSSEASSDVAQPVASSEVPDAAEEAPVAETPVEQEQPLTNQGLSESDAAQTSEVTAS